MRILNDSGMDNRLKMRSTSFLLKLLMISIGSYGQKVIPLYDGKIPVGSEILTLKETARQDSTGEIITIRNVSMPSITVFRPGKEKENGTAIIICPGGGFQGLAYQHEGLATARWCTENGITAFILKYRLMPFPYPQLDNAQRVQRDSIFTPFVRLAAADGMEAVRYVRSHAQEYNIDPAKIGMIGYSAGGTVCGSVAQTYSADSRPDFVAPVYAYCGAMIGEGVPEDAPPMFLAWASDDFIAKGNPILYKKWNDAGKSVEMHSFNGGGHGFSVIAQGKPSDKWIELFMEWMVNQGFIENNTEEGKVK